MNITDIIAVKNKIIPRRHEPSHFCKRYFKYSIIRNIADHELRGTSVLLSSTREIPFFIFPVHLGTSKKKKNKKTKKTFSKYYKISVWRRKRVFYFFGDCGTFLYAKIYRLYILILFPFEKYTFTFCLILYNAFVNDIQYYLE